MSTFDGLQTEIDTLNRQLSKLRVRKAQMGNSADVSLDMEIEDAEANLAQLEEELAGLGQEPVALTQSEKERQYQIALHWEENDGRGA